jgi:hypothetical protein
MTGRSSPRRLPILSAVVLLAATACAAPAQTPPPSAAASPSGGEIRVGAVFPLAGNAAGLAK